MKLDFNLQRRHTAATYTTCNAPEPVNIDGPWALGDPRHPAGRRDAARARPRLVPRLGATVRRSELRVDAERIAETSVFADQQGAALYGQTFDDPVGLAVVHEVEGLATGLSGEIRQKIVILEGTTVVSNQ